MEKKENEIFSEEDYIEMIKDGITEEEIEILRDAVAATETIDMLPDDVSGLIDKINMSIPEKTRDGIKSVLELSKNDPKTFIELMALVDIAKPDEAQELNSEKKKTLITELPDDKYIEAERAYYATLANLSNAEREEFLNMIKNITPEQKEDIVSRLVRK